MGLFDEPIPDKAKSKQIKVERIHFDNVSIYSEENTWGAEITVDVFDSEGDTADGVSAEIYYSGKRVDSA